MRLTKLMAFALMFLSTNAIAGFIERGPYLENMTSKSGVVRFRLDVSTPAWFTFGADSSCDKFQIFSPAAKEHKINLFGLTPDTTHCYKIFLPADGTDAVYEAYEDYFNSFRENDKPYFSFVAFGESGAGTAGSETQSKLSDLMSELTPDFVVHTGGLVKSGLDSDADNEYFIPYSTMIARVPFFAALSLSEYGPNYDKTSGKNFLRRNYSAYHSIPYTGALPYYYFFDVANARFFVLDANSFYGAKEAPKLIQGSKQYNWLEKYLAHSNRKDHQGLPERAWKFVVINAPIYSSGKIEPNTELVEALEPLFTRYGVDVVFQGMNRNYERTKLVNKGEEDEVKGVIYITLGGGGREMQGRAHDYEWTEVFSDKPHFAVVSVDGKVMNIKVYDDNAEIIDSFELQK